jgi:hypothetical protein
VPNVYEERGLRFYFFSNESNEPPHIHVTDEESVAKFWLNLSGNEVNLEYNEGFSARDMRRIWSILNRRSGMMRRAYNEYHKR